MIVPGFVFDAGVAFVRPPNTGLGIRLYGATSGAVGLKPPLIAGSTDFTLPASDGSAGQALVTNASGVLSFGILSSAAGGTGANNGSNTLTIGASASVSGSNTGDQTITLTGDVTGTGIGSFVATLKNTGSAGTYTKVTTDAQGRITSGTSIGSTDVTTALGYTPVNPTSLGANSGVATLDSGGKLTSSQIPASVTGAMTYQGTWNATSNSPTLVSSTGTKGFFYKVATAGTTAIDGISQWNIGDSIVFDGSTWDKIDGISNEVVSVAGKTGAVTLAYTDITGAAPLASPTFTGTPAAPTPSTGDSSTFLATTAFVKAQNYLTSNQTITLTGDATGSGTGSFAVTVGKSNGVAFGTAAFVATGTSGATIPLLNGGNTWSGDNTISTNGAVSTSPLLISGTIFTGGTATTTFPQFLVQPSAAAAFTAWSTAGTVSGINTGSGFSGDMVNYVTTFSVFKVSSAGNVTANGSVTAGSQLITSKTGAASAAAILASGSIFTGGTGTTTFPQILSQGGSSVAVTTWSTSGTIYGANPPTGFVGNFLDFHVNGGTSVFNVSAAGALVAASATIGAASIDANGALYGYLGKINAQTGTTYTIAASDAGKIVEVANASAITVTLPNSLAVGTCFRVVQTGAGQITFSAAFGATIHNFDSYTKTAGQWAEVDFYVTSNSGSAAVYVMQGRGA